MSDKPVVDRYDISNCGDRNCDPLVLSADGVYVEYAEYEALFAEVERLRTAEGDAMTYKAGMENVAQQRDQLRAEVEAFKAANSELSEINTARRNHLSNAKKAAGIGPMDDLVGAIEALRKDAERYRWLRTQCIPLSGHDFLSSHEILDRRVDAKILKESGE